MYIIPNLLQFIVLVDNFTKFVYSPQVNGAVFSYGKLIITNNELTTTTEDISPGFLITFKEKRPNVAPIPARGNASATTTLLPVYTNAKRDCLLCELEVSTTETVDTVLLSGAALIVADY